jgi:hypothetical protein
LTHFQLPVRVAARIALETNQVSTPEVAGGFQGELSIGKEEKP